MSVFKRWNGTQWETIGPSVTSARFDNINNMIAPEFDPKNTYNIGDYVVQSDKLYRCINRIGTPQSWYNGNWREVKLGEDVTDLRNNVVQVSNTQPTNNLNQIWIKPSNDNLSIPLSEDVMMLPHANDYGLNDQIPRSTGNGIEWVYQGLPTDAQTETAINAWLNAHPEATTTVQDHSLTYKKLINGTLEFVTPEMYDAYGDGEHDDSRALQDAINSNKNVFLTSKYLIKNIELKNNTVLFGYGTLIQDESQYMLLCTEKTNIIIDGINFKTSSNIFSTRNDGTIKFTSSSDISIRNISLDSSSDRNFLFLNCDNIIVNNFVVKHSGTAFTFSNSSNCICSDGVIYGDNTIQAHGIDFYAFLETICYNCVCYNIKGYDLISGLLQFTADQINDNISTFINYNFYNIIACNCSTVAKLDGIENCIFDRCIAINCDSGVAIGGLSTVRKIKKTIVKNCAFISSTSNYYRCTYAVDSSLVGDVYYDSNIVEDCKVIFSNDISGTLIIKNNRIFSNTITDLGSFSKSGAHPENIIFENNYIKGTYSNIYFPNGANNLYIFKNNKIILNNATTGTYFTLRCKNFIQFIDNIFQYQSLPKTFRINFPTNYTPLETDKITLLYGINTLLLPDSIYSFTFNTSGGASHYNATSINTTTIQT